MPERLWMPQPKLHVVRGETLHHPQGHERIGARTARNGSHVEPHLGRVFLEEYLGQQASDGTMLTDEEHRLYSARRNWLCIAG